MILNYLKVTIRQMMRNRLFTTINIFGMSVSLACCIILFIFTKSELNFDTHHGTDIYRLTSTLTKGDGEVFKTATSSIPIASTIQAEIPEIVDAGRITGSALFGGKNIIGYEGNTWFIENGCVADTNIFEILKFDIVFGNKSTPLAHKNGVVLEKSWATTIFGNRNPIGETIEISTNFGSSELEVTAVYDKSSYRAHLAPSFIMSMTNQQWNSFFNEDRTNWVGNNLVFSYLQLTPGANTQKVDNLIHEIFLKNGSEQMKAMGLTKVMDLQPVESIHTDTDFLINTPNTTNLTFLYVLGSIAIFILILACVNYINLSTAQSGKRSMEVGIRKVLGGSPGNLIAQFLGESFIIIFISMVIGLGLVQIAIPFFNQLINNPISFTIGSISEIGIYLFAFLLITGLIAGFYPAFYLASFKPQAVLKNSRKDGSGHTLLRKSLVVFQFVISICLISSILIISDQVDFIQNKDLGFRSDSKLIIPLSSEESSGNYELLKNTFETISEVQNISGSNGIPGMVLINDLLVYKDGQSMNDAIHIYNNDVDLDYAQLMGMKLLSGSYFVDYNKDTTIQKILISETGVKMLGFDLEEAPGEMVHFDWEGVTHDFEIVGVVNDVHQVSLHKTIDAMMYTIGNGQEYGFMTINASLTDFPGLISKLETQWKTINKDTPFDYYELNDHLILQYKSDLNTFKLIKYFAIISVIISCLGLYAMSLFTAEKRYREIGIRKTFGASIRNIFTMVSVDLSMLIFIAFLLSIPLTWYSMNLWLESFAYRITPGTGVYVIAGCISITIGWLTIGYQSVKAAKTNPIDVLKEE